MSRKIGLFVGINEYVNDKTATLRYAVKDASSMADVFKKSGYETYLLLTLHLLLCFLIFHKFFHQKISHRPHLTFIICQTGIQGEYVISSQDCC